MNNRMLSVLVLVLAFMFFPQFSVALPQMILDADATPNNPVWLPTSQFDFKYNCYDTNPNVTTSKQIKITSPSNLVTIFDETQLRLIDGNKYKSPSYNIDQEGVYTAYFFCGNDTVKQEALVNFTAKKMTVNYLNVPSGADIITLFPKDYFIDDKTADKRIRLSVMVNGNVLTDTSSENLEFVAYLVDSDDLVYALNIEPQYKQYANNEWILNPRINMD
ncbi:hypothetical protein GQ473_01185, partial [archaeon]|nr:hypothetical protein [archaeon]